MREKVLSNLAGEIRCLSFGEDALVKRMLMADGEIELDDEDQLPFVESLIRRLHSFRSHPELFSASFHAHKTLMPLLPR